MSFNLGGQATLFLSTVLVGAGIGLFYDVFRIFRRTTRFAKGVFVVQLEDLFFWVTVTGGMFYFMLNQNYGEIRMFSVLGAGIGIALYFATLSRLVMFVFVAVINYLKKVFAAAIRIITLPLRIIADFLAPYLKAIYKKLRSGLLRLLRYGKIRIRKTLRNWFILRKKV
ncbi:MAG: spore cortex biosynthesis protein YabQ [Clostridiales bacterium]|nr:spore cortex biosynthesis protein YabQ [Clostridiales bacterium]